MRFEPNRPAFAVEQVDGEIIAINLKNGAYYSMVGHAAAVWTALAKGRTAREIVAAAGGEQMGLADSLGQFVELLLAEQLIRPTQASPSQTALKLEPWPPEALRIEHFTDMQDLLVLDPIHEVDDEIGWPKPVG